MSDRSALFFLALLFLWGAFLVGEVVETALGLSSLVAKVLAGGLIVLMIGAYVLGTDGY
jgi:hypothetical protein